MKGFGRLVPILISPIFPNTVNNDANNVTLSKTN